MKKASAASSTTPLIEACALGEDYRLQELLTKKVADVDWADKKGLTALHIALQSNNTSCAKILLEQGKANVNLADRDGTTALHMAAHKGNLEAVQLLLKHGADVKKVVSSSCEGGSSSGHSGLTSDGNEQSAAVVEVLLNAGASVNDINSGAKTPLHVACKSGNAAVVSLLVKRGADVNKQDRMGVTAAGYAEGNEQVLKALGGR